MNPNECKNNIRNLNGTDSAKLNQFFYNASLTYSDRLSFQVEIEKRQWPFTVTKKNTVYTGLFTYQPMKYEWITGTSNSKLRCKDDADHLTDKDSWSLKIEQFSPDYYDKLNKLILECRTLPCLHSDGFCEPTLKHPDSNV